MTPLPSPAALAAGFAARARPLLSRLPMRPPSTVLARVLDRWLLPKLAPDVRQALSHRPVAVAVTDLGLDLRLQLGAAGFSAAPSNAMPALRLAAPAATFLRLASGADDADRLFFDRALVVEGDTEMGLVLKNTLDAIGPLWTWR